MSATLLYVTVPTLTEARKIARALLKEKLVACVNVHGPVTSLYRWEGKLQESSEHVVIAKTQTSRVASATQRIASLHSYDCPCVIALPVMGGYAPFLGWIHSETSTRPRAKKRRSVKR